jgi:hypothetical protein
MHTCAFVHLHCAFLISSHYSPRTSCEFSHPFLSNWRCNSTRSRRVRYKRKLNKSRCEPFLCWHSSTVLRSLRRVDSLLVFCRVVVMDRTGSLPLKYQRRSVLRRDSDDGDCAEPVLQGDEARCENRRADEMRLHAPPFHTATTFLHLRVSHHSSIDAALVLKKGLHCGGIGVIGDHRSIQ